MELRPKKTDWEGEEMEHKWAATTTVHIRVNRIRDDTTLVKENNVE